MPGEQRVCINSRGVFIGKPSFPNLAHYISDGVEELYQEKLAALLQLKYHGSISDAIADLGRPEDIGKAFAGFQKCLYQAPVICQTAFSGL